MARAHSFLWQMLPNFAGQFAECCGSLRQNCSNYAVYRGHLFVSKLSSIVSKNFSYWRLAFCSVML